MARRRSAVVRRSRSPYEARYMKERARVSGIARRARDEAMKREEMVLSLGSAALYGYARKSNWNLPTLGGIDPAILYGVALGIGGPMISKDKNGRRMESLGTGLLTIAAYNVARTGSFTIAGEGIHGDVEIVGDHMMGMGDELEDEDMDLDV